jgi:hypothetical protein
MGWRTKCVDLTDKQPVVEEIQLELEQCNQRVCVLDGLSSKLMRMQGSTMRAHPHHIRVSLKLYFKSIEASMLLVFVGSV